MWRAKATPFWAKLRGFPMGHKDHGKVRLSMKVARQGAARRNQERR